MHHISAVVTSYLTDFEITLKIYMILFFFSWKIVVNTGKIRKGKNYDIIDQIELSFF